MPDVFDQLDTNPQGDIFDRLAGSEAGQSGFGLRKDGTSKGPGWLGTLARPDGAVSTELSIGVNIDGRETLIPSLVPTLNRQEINHLLSGGEPTEQIVDKAVLHAKEKMARGLSPFKEKEAEGEGDVFDRLETQPKQDVFDRVASMAQGAYVPLDPDTLRPTGVTVKDIKTPQGTAQIPIGEEGLQEPSPLMDPVNLAVDVGTGFTTAPLRAGGKAILTNVVKDVAFGTAASGAMSGAEKLTDNQLAQMAAGIFGSAGAAISTQAMRKGLATYLKRTGRKLADMPDAQVAADFRQWFAEQPEFRATGDVPEPPGGAVAPDIVSTAGAASPPVGPAGVPLKGAPVGQGQKARSFAVGAANAEELAPEVRGIVADQIKPGGKGVYTPETLKGWEAAGEETLASMGDDQARRYAFSASGIGGFTPETAATGIALVKKLNKEKKYQDAADVALELADQYTKAGQTVASAKLLGELSPEGILVYAQRQINKLNKGRWFPKWIKEYSLTSDKAEQLSQLTSDMREAVDPNIKQELTMQLKGLLNDLKPSGIGKKLASAQTIAQLVNPKTQIRNIVGNELFFRMERLNKYVSAPIDWARSKITGGERSVTFRTEGQDGFWRGFLTGAGAGWKGLNPGGLTTQYDLGQGLAFKSGANPMNWLERVMGATMKGFDYAAYSRAHNQTLGELAALSSINKNGGKYVEADAQRFLKDIDENVYQIADDYGKYVTFQDNNVMSVTLSKLKRGLNLGQDFGFGDLVLKYPRTPGALLMRGMEYSPVGFLRSAYIAAKPWLKAGGKADTRESTLALGRAITGTMGLTGLGYFLYDKGVITGPANDDHDVAALQRQVGTHPYRVNLDALERWAINGYAPEHATPQRGDRYINYDWAQPLAMGMAMGANTADAVKQRQVFTRAIKNALVGTPDVAAAGLESAIGSLVEQPVLQGVLRLFRGYGPEGIASNLISIASDVPASFTPTLLSQLRQYTDNARRNTYDPNVLRKSLNKVLAKIPGMADSLPLAYDTMGYEARTYPGEGNSFFNVFLNPSFVSRLNPDLAESRALNVIDQTQSSGAAPRVAPRTIGVPVMRKGESIKRTIAVPLTGEEIGALQKTSGGLLRILNQTVPNMEALPVDIQEKLLVSFMLAAGQAGRKSIMPAVINRIRNDPALKGMRILTTEGLSNGN